MSRANTVYRNLTREELDRQYDQRTLVPEFVSLFEQWRSRSADFVRRYGRPERHAYGTLPAQGIDLFRAPRPLGLHVHFHGGAWKALDSEHAWWLAEPWLAAGYSFISVDFRLVPEVALAQQVADARQALLHARAIHSQGEELVVSGHSSGAHLAAMAVLASASNILIPACDHLVLASGIYDLEPVRLSARNDYLKLDAAEAGALSPRWQIENADARLVTLMWARRELDEFRRQSRDMAEALETAGARVRSIETAAATHFDTWDLISPDLLIA